MIQAQVIQRSEKKRTVVISVVENAVSLLSVVELARVVVTSVVVESVIVKFVATVVEVDVKNDEASDSVVVARVVASLVEVSAIVWLVRDVVLPVNVLSAVELPDRAAIVDVDAVSDVSVIDALLVLDCTSNVVVVAPDGNVNDVGVHKEVVEATVDVWADPVVDPVALAKVSELVEVAPSLTAVGEPSVEEETGMVELIADPDTVCVVGLSNVVLLDKVCTVCDWLDVTPLGRVCDVCDVLDEVLPSVDV